MKARPSFSSILIILSNCASPSIVFIVDFITNTTETVSTVNRHYAALDKYESGITVMGSYFITSLAISNEIVTNKTSIIVGSG